MSRGHWAQRGQRRQRLGLVPLLLSFPLREAGVAIPRPPPRARRPASQAGWPSDGVAPRPRPPSCPQQGSSRLPRGPCGLGSRHQLQQGPVAVWSYRPPRLQAGRSRPPGVPPGSRGSGLRRGLGPSQGKVHHVPSHTDSLSQVTRLPVWRTRLCHLSVTSLSGEAVSSRLRQLREGSEERMGEAKQLGPQD